MKNRQQKRATCFAALLQNELKSDVARFTSHVQTCPVTNHLVSGSEIVLQKVESSCTFFNKICACSAFYRANACFAVSDVTPA